MKAIKFFALVAALLAVGCTNELMDDSINQNNNVEDGIILTLTGEAQAEEVESRILIDGSKNKDGKYQIRWRNEDTLGLFSEDGTTINNVPAPENSILPDENGKYTTEHYATFATETAVSANVGDDLYIYYPHNTTTSFSNGVFSSNVAALQMTNDLTVAYGFAPYTFAYDKTTVNGGNFSLTHPLAYVRVKVKATDYVKGWVLKGVQIVDRNGVAKLSGDYTVDTATGELTVTNGSSSVEQYFKVATNNNAKTIEETSGYDNRFIMLVSLPHNFEGSDVWVVAKFIDKDTKQEISVPTQYKNVELKAGVLNVINLTLNEGEHSAAGWYEPIDTRMMPGLGYAYGDQNTYLIQCKSGSTYNGATYTPNANIPDEVKVDIRGRGDFSKVVDVTKATFAWFKKGKQTDIVGQGAGSVYAGQTSNYSASKVDPTKYTIDDSTKAQGYITVKNTGAYAGAPILLMIVDNKIVWSWSFWNIAADGTTLEGVDVGNGTKIANMLIGQPTTNYKTWASNKNGSNPDPIYRFIHFYQWGRTMPHFWTSWWTVDPGDGTTNVNLPIIKTENPLTLAESVARPVGVITTLTPEVAHTSWCADDYTQFWGANGVKSVYDPCPKGWRVADSATYSYMTSNGAVSYVDTTVDTSDYYGAPGAIYNSTPNILLVAGGYLNGYISSNGRFQSQGAGSNGQSSYGAAWSSKIEPSGENEGKPYRLVSGWINRKQFETTSASANTLSANVRCQVDTDNR